MKLCNLDGEQYLLTVPNRTQMLEFQKLQEVLGNGEMEQYRLDGYYYQQMYPHPQGTQSSIMVRNKKEKETLQVAVRVTGGTEPINLLSTMRTGYARIRPMLIPLDSNGFFDPDVQGDCPNGTLTKGGCITINDQPVRIATRKRLNDDDKILVIDTPNNEALTQTWMWWNGRLICCSCQLSAKPWFIFNNGMAGDVM